MHIALWFSYIFFELNTLTASVDLRSKSWPYFKREDVWNLVSRPKTSQPLKNVQLKAFTISSRKDNKIKEGKVFNFFPLPVDGECFSTDGRRTGTCLNKYECRQSGGTSHGECSMGFGVCCIFLAACDQTIRNNITYLVSPNFPNSMPSNLTVCKYKLKIIDSNVSQLRFDFSHFSLGQPNRKTGICDGDLFTISGGSSGSFLLCGQNSGQHVYYEVGSHHTNFSQKKTPKRRTRSNETIPKPRLYEEKNIEITIVFSNRFSPLRFWEIRVAKIRFSQRAPANCLQYFIGSTGIIQTFNFADNGRHLANQNYKACIRQEENMCSIMYQPCDDQSFKIGPTKVFTEEQNNMMAVDSTPVESNNFLSTNATIFNDQSSNVSSLIGASNPALSNSSYNSVDSEGSGEDNFEITLETSEKPTRGGFDILSLLRNALNLREIGRSTRQLFTTCNDRITLPCVIEDFVGVGISHLPECEPVHCGNRFCSSDASPCRIESTVTPFYLGVHFGKGVGKGSAEDNIGACIRYTQMQCI